MEIWRFALTVRKSIVSMDMDVSRIAFMDVLIVQGDIMELSGLESARSVTGREDSG